MQANLFYFGSSRQGANATRDELTTSAFLTVQLDRSLGGQAVQVGMFLPPKLIQVLQAQCLLKTLLPRQDADLTLCKYFLFYISEFKYSYSHALLVFSDSGKEGTNKYLKIETKISY